jgi:ERCC4-type nuclease
MIQVDNRIGSLELASPLRKLGVKVTTCRLPFGDACFTGSGPTDTCRVGIERKTLSEIVTAITDTRFTGYQLPGLIKAYDVRILIIEGRYWAEPNSGILYINGREAGYARRRYMYSEVEHFIMSIQRKAGLWVWPTASLKDTVWWIHACYTWYQKPWSNHKSVYAIDEVRPDAAILDERTLLRRLAAQLPGIGWTRSKAVESHFGSVRAMVNATVADWCEIDGIGEGIARKVVRACRVAK